ncbi:MAG: acetyltransferase [Acholeplasma sp.]|nr:acetyltransferase [Acholeplasma sp.]
MVKELIIIGNGTHSKVVSEIAVENGYTVIGFIESSSDKKNTLGTLSDLDQIKIKYPNAFFFIALGSNEIRKEIAEKHPDLVYATLISKNAYVSASASIKEGTVIMHRAVVNTNATIGSHSIVNTGAIIEHDNKIGNFTYITSGVTVGSSTTIGDLCLIGMNSTIRNNIHITSNVTIGMGGVVTRSIDEAGIYIGIPAKKYIK